VTNKQPHDAVEIYSRRQEIETLFGCLKTRGFRFEDTHITDQKRIKKLLVLLAVAFCWAYKTGEWRHKFIEPIKLKSHGRKEKSVFRHGLDFIRETLITTYKKIQNFGKCLIFITPQYEDLCYAGRVSL